MFLFRQTRANFSNPVLIQILILLQWNSVALSAALWQRYHSLSYCAILFFPTQFPSLLIFLIWEYHFKKQTVFVWILWAHIFHTCKVFTLLDLIELPILPSLKSLNFWILCYSNHVQVRVAIGRLAHETK